jgi:hypothetical protein
VHVGEAAVRRDARLAAREQIGKLEERGQPLRGIVAVQLLLELCDVLIHLSSPFGFARLSRADVLCLRAPVSQPV